MRHNYEEKKEAGVCQYNSMGVDCRDSCACSHFIHMDIYRTVDMAGADPSGVFQKGGSGGGGMKKRAFADIGVKYSDLRGYGGFIRSDRPDDGKSPDLILLSREKTDVFFHHPSLYGACHCICNGNTGHIY